MPEYSRILIEEYCVYHPRTKKAKLLSRLVKLSYYLDSEVSDVDMEQLEKYIEVEKMLTSAEKDLWRLSADLNTRKALQ